MSTPQSGQQVTDNTTTTTTTTVISIDKSQAPPEDDEDEDQEDYDTAATEMAQGGEGDDDLIDQGYVEGEGDERFEIDPDAEGYEDEDDDEDDEVENKGDSEEHDGENYDDSIVNMAKETFKLHKDSVFSITLDEKEQILISGSGDDTAVLLDLATNATLYHFNQDFNDSIIKVAFSPQYAPNNQKYLAIASMSGLIRIYTMESILEYRNTIRSTSQTPDQQQPELDFYTEFDPEFDLDMIAWHPTQPLIAAGCSNGQLWTFNLDTHESKAFYGHNDGITALTFNADGSSLYSTSLDGQVIINPLVKDKKQIKHRQLDKDSPAGISLIPHPDSNAQIICLGSAAGGLYTVSATDIVHGGVKNATAHSDSIEKISFYQVNPKTLYLFSSSIDGTLKAWNYTDSLQARYTIALPYAVTSFVFHPVVQLLFVGSHDGIVRVHHAVNGKHIADITGHQDAILDMIVTKDNLYTCSDDKTIRIFVLKDILPEDALTPPPSTTTTIVGAGSQVGKPNIVGGNFARRPVVKPGKPGQAAPSKPE